VPTYTFVCPECNYKFRDMFSMSQSSGENVVCPNYHYKGLKRVYEKFFSL
jgi:putative FmdB family regulatory protein